MLFLLLSLLLGLSSSDSSRASGGDETDLLTVGSASFDGRGLADVLMVTTSVRMFDGVHSHTTNDRPAVSLRLIFVISATGSQDWFVGTTTASHDSDHSSVGRRNDLLRSGWQSDASSSGVRIVSDDRRVIARSARQPASISRLLFQIANNRSFRQSPDGQNIPNLDSSFLSAINELPGVESFGGDHGFATSLVAVRISELDESQGGASTGIVDDVLDHSLDVSVSLSEVDRSQLRRTLLVLVVRFEDRGRSLALRANSSTHLVLKLKA